jgi:hypothetical protein
MHRANVPVPAVIIRDTEASMSDIVQQFNDYRSRMNERVLETDNKVIKRFFNLDTNAYLDGALPGRTKEMMGLVASMVLRWAVEFLDILEATP